MADDAASRTALGNATADAASSERATNGSRANEVARATDACKGEAGDELACGPVRAVPETAELAAFGISTAGPMFGCGMPPASGYAAQLELEIWNKHVPHVPLHKLRRRGEPVSNLSLTISLNLVG